MDRRPEVASPDAEMEGAVVTRRLPGNVGEYRFDLAAIGGAGIVRDTVMREPGTLLVERTERQGTRGAPVR